MNDEAFEAAYTYAHPRGWEGREPTREQMRPFLAWYLEAAHPWRPLTEDVPRNVVLELRVPGEEGRQFIKVRDVAFDAMAFVSIGRMTETPEGFAMVHNGPRLAQLIAAGAEYREMLPC
jgi:hypothetical protein